MSTSIARQQYNNTFRWSSFDSFPALIEWTRVCKCPLQFNLITVCVKATFSTFLLFKYLPVTRKQFLVVAASDIHRGRIKRTWSNNAISAKFNARSCVNIALNHRPSERQHPHNANSYELVGMDRAQISAAAIEQSEIQGLFLSRTKQRNRIF